MSTNNWILYRALRVALIATMLCIYVDTTHFPVGRWAVLTVVIVSNLYYGASVKKSWDRLLGTVLGCFVGYFFGIFCIHYHYNLVYTLPVFMFLAWYLLVISYAWMMFFGMIMLMCILYMASPVGTDVAQYALARSIDIALGIGVAVIGEILFPIKRNYDLVQEKIKLLEQKQHELLTKFQVLLTEKQRLSVVEIEQDLKLLQQLQAQIAPLLNLLKYEIGVYSEEKNLALKNKFMDEQKVTWRLNNFYIAFQSQNQNQLLEKELQEILAQ